MIASFLALIESIYIETIGSSHSITASESGSTLDRVKEAANKWNP